MKNELFFGNARLLNEKLDIIPLMYGSLGLEYITGEKLAADDIDILIPDIFVKERWCEFKDLLTNEGYVLFDEHEHAFRKNGVVYAYAAIEELELFAGIKIPEISKREKDGAKFKLLSLKQYLKVYETSVKDGYRINVRKKKDNEKIAFIKDKLKAENA